MRAPAGEAHWCIEPSGVKMAFPVNPAGGAMLYAHHASLSEYFLSECLRCGAALGCHNMTIRNWGARSS